MFEYCIVRYTFKGGFTFKGVGLTQEISDIYMNGKKLDEWKNKYWIDFLNFMGERGWELTVVTQTSSSPPCAYFKRELDKPSLT